MNEEKELLKRITVNPGVKRGSPCIRETKILASTMLDCMAAGGSIELILNAFSELTEEDLRACFAYAAEMMRKLNPIGYPRVV